MSRPAVRTRAPQARVAIPAEDYPGSGPRPANPADAWMDKSFRFAGSVIKRKTVACVLLAIPALGPVFFISRAVIIRDNFVMDQIEADVLGTGGMINLLLTLTVTPMVTLTGQHWFVPLRRWYGIMFAVTSFTDATIASITTAFRGGVLGRLTGHIFLLVGLMMIMLLIPLVLTANNRALRWLGRYWKPLQRTTYAIWGLLWVHLALLEGFGPQQGTNGPSGLPDPFPFNVAHQRLYELTACSLPLLLLRLPPVRRWVAAKRAAGREWVVYCAFAPLTILFVLFFSFIINEELFKGIGAFRLQVPDTPSPQA